MLLIQSNEYKRNNFWFIVKKNAVLSELHFSDTINLKLKNYYLMQN